MGQQNEIEGVLHLFSETGTEGGDWALQDARYIQKNVPRGYCKKCGKWLKKQEGNLQIGRVTVITAEVVEEFRRTGKLPERVDCANEAHEEDIGEVWSYKGLHILKDGDYLMIFDKQDPRKLVWDDTIQLRHYDSFTEHTSNGMWIHSDQEGVPREVWEKFFLEGYPAKLSLYPRPVRQAIADGIKGFLGLPRTRN